MMKDSLNVIQNEDGSFSIEWNPDDERWSWLNSMTEEEISKMLSDYVRENVTDSLVTDDSLTPDA
jgi:hypothetical protein|tara:strand:+ start:326 stop:520 length:195 start_codon:yes stop_codon:yes gene_type:complete